MEELKKDKPLNILKWAFIILTVIHIIYATISMRGMYMDGAFYMIDFLNKYSNHDYSITWDNGHCRFCILALLQLPVIFFQFFIKNKMFLTMVYSFSQLALPAIALWINYKLTKRTGRVDIFFWNLFFYGSILLLFMVASVIENILGIALNFILWNYLASQIDYKKKDIVFIIILLIIMFSTFEYIVYTGLIFFAAHFYYLRGEKSELNKKIKRIIGYGALCASLYDIWFMLKTPGENGELLRFLGEAVNVLPWVFKLNSLISIFSIILLAIIVFKKTKLSNISIILFSLIYCGLFYRLITTLQDSLWPMWEIHFRVYACFLIPFIFMIMLLRDIFNKNKELNYIRYSNCTCIVLLCAIFLTLWQGVDTYFWNKNINYMKSELAKEEGPLYLPARHDEMSSFGNEKLRRYIWSGVFAATSIIFSDSYKQKTLLVNVDYIDDFSYRNRLYVYPDEENAMSIPYGAKINIKNKYWDLTECAKALDKYNKENNIPTDN